MDDDENCFAIFLEGGCAFLCAIIIILLCEAVLIVPIKLACGNNYLCQASLAFGIGAFLLGSIILYGRIVRRNQQGWRWSTTNDESGRTTTTTTSIAAAPAQYTTNANGKEIKGRTLESNEAEQRVTIASNSPNDEGQQQLAASASVPNETSLSMPD